MSKLEDFDSKIESAIKNAQEEVDSDEVSNPANPLDYYTGKFSAIGEIAKFTTDSWQSVLGLYSKRLQATRLALRTANEFAANDNRTHSSSTSHQERQVGINKIAELQKELDKKMAEAEAEELRIQQEEDTRRKQIEKEREELMKLEEVKEETVIPQPTIPNAKVSRPNENRLRSAQKQHNIENWLDNEGSSGQSSWVNNGGRG